MLGMQAWCCARQCSQACSGTLRVLRQIPVTIIKPVVLSAGYNFAKKAISAMKAEATSLPCSMSSQLCVRRRIKEQLLKYLCVHEVIYLLYLSQKCQYSPGKTSPSSAPPQISAWGRNVRPSGGVRGFGLLGDYPCSCSAALHAWCSRADAEAQHPSWQAQVGHTTST